VTKLSPDKARAMLEAAGVDFRKDFHALSSADVDLILEAAKLAGYRKSKGAPGSTARMYFQHLEKKAARPSGGDDWKTVHKLSGATVIERHFKNCKLTVVPANWTNPQGAASWSVTCGDATPSSQPAWRDVGFQHKRGSASTVKGAKAAALHAAKKMSVR
jgi:hypothetical protein